LAGRWSSTEASLAVEKAMARSRDESGGDGRWTESNSMTMTERGFKAKIEMLEALLSMMILRYGG
jgi:hypothetical protein